MERTKRKKYIAAVKPSIVARAHFWRAAYEAADSGAINHVKADHCFKITFWALKELQNLTPQPSGQVPDLGLYLFSKYIFSSSKVLFMKSPL